VARVRELENIRNFLTSSALTLVIDLVFTFVFIVVAFLGQRLRAAAAEEAGWPGAAWCPAGHRGTGAAAAAAAGLTVRCASRCSMAMGSSRTR